MEKEDLEKITEALKVKQKTSFLSITISTLMVISFTISVVLLNTSINSKQDAIADLQRTNNLFLDSLELLSKSKFNQYLDNAATERNVSKEQIDTIKYLKIINGLNGELKNKASENQLLSDSIRNLINNPKVKTVVEKFIETDTLFVRDSIFVRFSFEEVVYSDRKEKFELAESVSTTTEYIERSVKLDTLSDARYIVFEVKLKNVSEQKMRISMAKDRLASDSLDGVKIKRELYEPNHWARFVFFPLVSKIRPQESIIFKIVIDRFALKSENIDIDVPLDLNNEELFFTLRLN